MTDPTSAESPAAEPSPPAPHWCPLCAYARTCELCDTSPRVISRCLCRAPEHEPGCAARHDPACLPPPVPRRIPTGYGRTMDGLPVQQWYLDEVVNGAPAKRAKPASKPASKVSGIASGVDARIDDMRLAISKGPRPPAPTVVLSEPTEVCILDTETTGNRVGKDRMIELACAILTLPVFARVDPHPDAIDQSMHMVSPGRIGRVATTLVHPGTDPYTGQQVPIHWQATKVHGYRDRDVAKAPPVEVIIAKFLAWLNGRPILAHNASFDVGMLRDAMDRAQICGAERTHVDVYDSLAIARKVLPMLPHHRLSDLATYYSVDAGRAHRAGSDVSTLAGVVLGLLATAGKGLAEVHGNAETL